MKILSLLKQIVPRIYYSKYKTNGHHEVAIWRMWFGRAYDITRFEVA